MFFNRENEFEYLESRYSSKEAQLLIFWGRRRIGKTFFLQEFCKRKNGLLLMATTSSARDNLENFSQVLADYFADERLAMHPLESYEEFLVYLNEKVQRRTIIVIDEYPYLVENTPSISSIFQKYWDSNLQYNSNLMLILNGSAVSMMEKETLEYRSPLYGRRTGQWFMCPFDAVSANKFFEFKKLVQAIEMYILTGGVPYYCKVLSGQKDVFSAIKNKMLAKGEVLFEEVYFLLRQEFKTPRSYFPILKTIARGVHKFGEISSKTGYDKSNLIKYISTLEKLKLIRREVPVTEINPQKSRKSLYFINDNFIDFWFNFIFPYQSDLEYGDTEKVLNSIIRPKFDYYVSQKVEPVIIDLLKKDYFNLGFNFKKIGRYWDKNMEIDIMGELDDNQMVFGGIKWLKTPCKKEVYYDLIKKAEILKLNKNIIYMIISRSGFSKALQDLSGEQLVLVELNNFYLK